jgi:tetratricopeptide (TPR) repeat protein
VTVRAARTALGLLLCTCLATAAWADASELQDFDELWDYGDPAATEAKFREIEPRARAAGDVDYLVQLLTQIARTKGLRGDFDGANAVLDEAEKLLTPTCVVGRIRYLLERGRTLNSAHKRPEAIRIFEQALRAATQAGTDFHRVDAAHMLGIAEEPEKALAWNLKAIAMAEAAKSEKARMWLGALYNNTAWTYHDSKEYGRALDLFEKALAHCLAHCIERGQEAQIRIARWSVGRALRSLGRFEEALALQRVLLEAYRKADSQDDGFVLEEIGEILWAQGNKRLARPWLRRAHERLSKVDWMVRTEAERLARLKARGGVADEPVAGGGSGDDAEAGK